MSFCKMTALAAIPVSTWLDEEQCRTTPPLRQTASRCFLAASVFINQRAAISPHSHCYIVLKRRAVKTVSDCSSVEAGDGA